VIIIYQGYNSPLKGKLRNRIELFNEASIHAASLHLVFFTEWTSDPELQFQFGWSMLAVIVFCMTVNFILIFYTGLRQIFILFKGIYVRIKAKINARGKQVKSLPQKYDELIKKERLASSSSKDSSVSEASLRQEAPRNIALPWWAQTFPA